MHVLRAEKGYPIIGQDTDGTVTPQDLGMGWVVSKKKPDFIGKRSFTRGGEPQPAAQAARRTAAGRPGNRPARGRADHRTGRRRRPAPAARADARPRHLQLPQRRTGPAVRARPGQGRPMPASATACTSRWTARWCRSRSPAPSSSIPKEHAAMADTLTATSPLQSWARSSRTSRNGDPQRGALRRDGGPVGRSERAGGARGRRRSSG